MRSADLPVTNNQNLSAFQPRVNDSLVIFPLKTASKPWVVKKASSSSSKVDSGSRTRGSWIITAQREGAARAAVGCTGFGSGVDEAEVAKHPFEEELLQRVFHPVHLGITGSRM